jgi:decaprenyl-phosphate phosphoribosyltransferase
MTARTRTTMARPASAASSAPPGSAQPPAVGKPSRVRRALDVLLAGAVAARPRQWPKNLLVFAAPLAGASLGRDDGFGYAVVAAAAFTSASASVYLVNDVIDADRDRRHPVKRRRPVAAGRLPVPCALTLAAIGLVLAAAACARIGSPALAVTVSAYIASSVLYSLWLKHVPGVEMAFVATGFVLRALGGAVATHVPPSAWFLTVCSLGALLVATGKRYTELSVLGEAAAGHRPVMRWYSIAGLRTAQRAVTGAMLASYLLWALSEPDGWMRGWHLISVLPLAVALVRFDRLTGLAEDRPVEDLITRDPMMMCTEATWLTLFLVGL